MIFFFFQYTYLGRILKTISFVRLIYAIYLGYIWFKDLFSLIPTFRSLFNIFGHGKKHALILHAM